MNPEQIKAWALAGSAAIAALKEVIPLLPSGAKKEEAERAIARAEQEMKEAEASAAKKLGFEICPRCWPPEIMTFGDDDLYRCRACGKPIPGSGSGTMKVRTHGTEQQR